MNRHVLRQWILSPPRLPIPPPRQIEAELLQKMSSLARPKPYIKVSYKKVTEGKARKMRLSQNKGRCTKRVT